MKGRKLNSLPFRPLTGLRPGGRRGGEGRGGGRGSFLARLRCLFFPFCAEDISKFGIPFWISARRRRRFLPKEEDPTRVINFTLSLFPPLRLYLSLPARKKPGSFVRRARSAFFGVETSEMPRNPIVSRYFFAKKSLEILQKHRAFSVVLTIPLLRASGKLIGAPTFPGHSV